MKPQFWGNKRVFITGHTGFKGSWLSLWLSFLGAHITGYSLEPPTNPSLYKLAKIDELLESNIADIRNLDKLTRVLKASKPEIVFHLAAQPIVRASYKQPVESFSTNVMGTVNLLEAVRNNSGIQAVVNITSDKCYDNKGLARGYKESDPLGGYDPYSSSKACQELVTTAYRSSYGLNVATARAGNVIGGGDWAADRLVPDFVRAVLANKEILIRNPKAVRPWQHVLEPLAGYLILGEKLYKQPGQYAKAWNFGPQDKDAKSVEWIIKKLCAQWGDSCSYVIDKGPHPHEAHYLKLDCTQAKQGLKWQPKWNLGVALDKVIDWTRAYMNKEDLRQTCFRQIKEYVR